MSKKGILRNVEIPIYRIVINVVIDKTCKKAIKLSKRLESNFLKYGQWRRTYGAYCHSVEENIHAIVLAGDANIETISHECFHAVMTVLQLNGVRYSQKSEEAFAYVLGYLTEQVYNIKKEYESNN